MQKTRLGVVSGEENELIPSCLSWPGPIEDTSLWLGCSAHSPPNSRGGDRRTECLGLHSAGRVSPGISTSLGGQHWQDTVSPGPPRSQPPPRAPQPPTVGCWTHFATTVFMWVRTSPKYWSICACKEQEETKSRRQEPGRGTPNAPLQPHLPGTCHIQRGE